MAKKKPKKDKESDKDKEPYCPGGKEPYYPGGYETETIILKKDREKEKRERHI